MPFTLQPTYQHSRRRAAASLARHGDVDEAVRVARVPQAMVEAWLADAEFGRLVEHAKRRARRQLLRQLVDPLRLQQVAAKKRACEESHASA